MAVAIPGSGAWPERSGDGSRSPPQYLKIIDGQVGLGWYKQKCLDIAESREAVFLWCRKSSRRKQAALSMKNVMGLLLMLGEEHHIAGKPGW